jgi:hypothetical protein
MPSLDGNIHECRPGGSCPYCEAPDPEAETTECAICGTTIAVEDKPVCSRSCARALYDEREV